MKNPMKKLPVLVMTALCATAVLAEEPATPLNPPAAQAAQSQAYILSRADLDKLLAQPDKVLVIDLRRPDEVSKVGGFAVYLSIQPDELEKSLAWIPKDRTIVTVSNHSGRSGKAADLLTLHGFKVAGAAGAKLYEEEGGTLTKIAIPPPTTATTSTSTAN